ncbi:MAG: hypothetical protein AB7S72_18205 [Draconibacterium sp.]
MGFFDLVNIRAINTKLKELMPVVDANMSRMESYYKSNFKKIKKNEWGSSKEILVTKKENIDELLRQKKELELEFENVHNIVEKIKPITFLDDDSSYIHWKNELASVSWRYNFLIEELNSFEIYTEK